MLLTSICVPQVYSVHCLKPTKSQRFQLTRCLRHWVVSVYSPWLCTCALTWSSSSSCPFYWSSCRLMFLSKFCLEPKKTNPRQQKRYLWLTIAPTNKKTTLIYNLLVLLFFRPSVEIPEGEKIYRLRQCRTLKFIIRSGFVAEALTVWGHEFDLSRSRDFIGHVTIWYPICYFLLVVLWHKASISNGFRDIQHRT